MFAPIQAFNGLDIVLAGLIPLLNRLRDLLGDHAGHAPNTLFRVTFFLGFLLFFA